MLDWFRPVIANETKNDDGHQCQSKLDFVALKQRQNDIIA